MSSRASQSSASRRARTAAPLLVLLCGMTCYLAACSSVHLPTVEQSRAETVRHAARLDSAEARVRAAGAVVPGGADLVTRVRMDALNRITRAFVYVRSDDVRLRFLPTRPLVKAEKSILGISYTNTLDIDSGAVVLNLAQFRFDRFENNRLEADLVIEGHGRIAASGRYTGIPASAKPDIDLSLNERIAFDVRATDTGTAVLKPVSRTLMLKARFTVTLLEWGIPWNQDIPIQLSEIMQPLVIPLALRTEVAFPVPSQKVNAGSFEFVPHLLEFSHASVSARSNVLEFRTAIGFRKVDAR
ncbi:MAG: hypothetical protein HY962_15075 [Ignavibacteriae bacterium]|nr:hypothetical protein [Ignavibacteriota bacterium]